MANKTTMERTLETLVEFAAVQRDSLNRLTQSIQTMNSHLGDKLDRLGEKIDLLAGGMGDLSGNVAATNRAIEGQLIVANKQSENIAQLIALAQQQQATVDRLMSRN
jgi:methyl-accepting chemotaxis protein